MESSSDDTSHVHVFVLSKCRISAVRRRFDAENREREKCLVRGLWKTMRPNAKQKRANVKFMFFLKISFAE